MTDEEKINTGLKLQESGDFVRAAELYLSIPKGSAYYADALHLLGLCRLNQSQHEEAIDLITRATELKPMAAIYYCNRGNVYHLMRNFKLAEKDYQRALGLAPNYRDALQNYGNLLVKMGDSNKALKKFYKILEIEPDNPRAVVAIANLLQSSGDGESALQGWLYAVGLLQNTLKKYPEHFEAWHSLGHLFYTVAPFAQKQKKMYSMAAEAFSQADELQPGNEQVMNNIGASLKDAGRIQESIDYYRVMLEQFPNDYAALHNIGNNLHAQGEIEEAIEYNERLLELQKHDDLEMRAAQFSSHLFTYLSHEPDFEVVAKRFCQFHSEVAINA